MRWVFFFFFLVKAFLLFQLSWLSDVGHSGNMVEYIYRLFFSDKKIGSFISWGYNTQNMALESTSCLSLMPNKECSWTFYSFFFFSSFFDERNVVELTKQTRQRIESKDLKTLCETRKLYIFLVSLCENEKTIYIFFFNHFPQFYFTTILLMILWKTWITSHLCQQTTLLVVPDEKFQTLS